MSVRIGSAAGESAAGASPGVRCPATAPARFSLPGALVWPPIASFPAACELTPALRPMILPSLPTGPAASARGRSRPRSVSRRCPHMRVPELSPTTGGLARPLVSGPCMRHYRRSTYRNYLADRADSGRVAACVALLADGPPSAWPGLSLAGACPAFLNRAEAELADGALLPRGASASARHECLVVARLRPARQIRDGRVLLHQPDDA